MKHIILLLSALMLVLVGCKKEPGGLSESERNASLVFDRADITGAEYLRVTQSTTSKSKSTTDNTDIFKIDKDGNMTAVVFYMSYTKDADGNPIPNGEVRTDVKVIPEKITNFGGIYTHFANCSFIDGNGEIIYISYGRNFLIRNSDGAVFKLFADNAAINDLEPLTYKDNKRKTIQFDAKNDMYFCYDLYPNDLIQKLTTQGKNLVIQDITPYGMKAMSFVLSDTEGVVVGGDPIDGAFQDYNPTAVYYPYGGFEIISLPSTTLCAVGGQFKTFEQEKIYIAESNTNMCKTTINNILFTSHPPYSFNIEATDESESVPMMGRVAFAVDCKDHYVIGGKEYKYDEESNTLLCVVNKGSKKIQFITLDKFPASTRASNYGYYHYPDRIGNTIFSIDGTTKTIKSYNFETLQYREVQYDDSELGGFFEQGSSFENNPPTYIKYGTRGVDGRFVTVEINIETGATKVSVGGDSRETKILVRIS